MPSKNLRVADRLAAARGARFIARQAELDVFTTAPAAGKPPFTVLYVHGPGGVGKTTLLREFARLARGAHRTVIALDGRDVPASRRAFRRALEEATRVAGASGDGRRAVPDRYSPPDATAGGGWRITRTV